MANILLLNCDFDTDQETNGASLLRSYLQMESTHSITVKHSHAGEMPTNDELQHTDCIIITGSRASCYDDASWIQELHEVVKAIHARGIPTLGICFGHQLIARALGGVVRPSGLYEEGYCEITLSSDAEKHLLFQGLPKNIYVYQSHGDVVTMMPPTGWTLALNDFCLQAYAVGSFVCVQFHPEITPAVAKIMANRDGQNVEQLLQRIPDGYTLPLFIVRNFVNGAVQVISSSSLVL